MENFSISDLICGLFAARDAAHELHLKTRSFAQHMALGDLYDGLVEMADAVAETHQGKYGLMDLSKCSNPVQFDKTNAQVFVQQLAGWVEGARGIFHPADTNLLNEWDNVISLVYQTKYKLENLA